jgi:hypothetical protein
MHRRGTAKMRRAAVLALGLFALGCSSGKNGGSPDTVADTAFDASIADVAGETTADAATPEVAVEIDGSDAGIDVGPPEPETPVLGPVMAPPGASVLPVELSPCATILDTQCVDGKQQVCEVYDAAAGQWTEGPAMTRQAFMFDRYYDLYHEVVGQTMDFRFSQSVPAGTPEEEWSKPEYFRKYDGYGDASGWTGTAVWAAAARYATTGTPADYERMVDKLEWMLFMYEVNDIPGMIIRSHWAMLEEGAPEPNGLWGQSVTNWRPCVGDGHFCYPIAEKHLQRLPDYYTQGVEIGGQHYATAPHFQGDASRDMYVRGLPGIMLALDLLAEGDKEDQLRAAAVAELPCTVNRLKKGRIFNLSKNLEVKDSLMVFLAGPNMTLEPGEEEVFTQVDQLVFFIMEQPRPDKMDLLDPTCPDGPPMEFDPEYELDATDPMFLLDLGLMLAREGGQGDLPIAWSQHVSVRGSDTLFVTQWALVAHYLTGDQRYLDFVNQLMSEIDYFGVIDTYGAFLLPKWCRPHYGPSLIYPTLYNLLARIDKQEYPTYWARLSAAAVSEGKEKDMKGREDSFWAVLYHSMTDETTDPERGDYVAYHTKLLESYGMDPERKFEPDRNYPRNFIDNPIPSIPLEEIGADNLAVCTEPISVLGLEIDNNSLEDDWLRAVDAIPLPQRVGGGFLWQMDPWMAKREYGGAGMDEQWPMLGMTVAYWAGRAHGLITEGQGLGLAWQPTQEACE